MRWDRPLTPVPGEANTWGLREMLLTNAAGLFHSAAGPLGVGATVSSRDGLAVHSFVAAPEVGRAELAAAAVAWLADWWSDGAPPEALSPARLAGRGHAWSIEPGYCDDDAVVPAFEERAECVGIAGLPAVAAAAAVLRALVEEAVPERMRPVSVDAAMSAVARFDRRGFEAAAIAAMAPRAAAMPDRRLVLHLRFDRPHLVVAVATDEAYRGLPLFAAWVDAGVREPERE